MIYSNEKVNKKIPIRNYEDVYVLADFDRTITKDSSKTSWSILAHTDLLPKEYATERQKLYEYYRPMEIDLGIPEEKRQQIMKEWFQKHLDLFPKYKLRKEIIEEAAKDTSIMEFRKGVKEFLQFLYDHQIPLIIISAGIGNFVRCFLENNDCYYSNIHIASNMILFNEENIATGSEENIIHSMNKNEVVLTKEMKDKIKNRNNVIVLGDQIDDIKMVHEAKREDAIKVGFLTEENLKNAKQYRNAFDIVCTNEVSYDDLGKRLFESYE